MKGPILKGEKVILKPLAINQAETFLRWINDYEVNRFLIIDGRGLTLEKEKEFIKKSNKDKNVLRWSIYTKDGAHIGNRVCIILTKKI